MEINAIQAGFNLDHIAIETNDKNKLANFYKNIMKMKHVVRRNNDIICMGPSRKLIIRDGKKNKFSFAGFSCKDKKNLNYFKSFVIKNGVKILDFQNPYLKKESFSISVP